MRRIKLDESQRDEIINILYEMISEELNINNEITINKTNPTQNDMLNPMTALNNVNRAAKQNGIDTNNPNVTTSTIGNVNGRKSEITAKPIGESVIITKEQLNNIRLRELKRESQVIKLKDLFKK